VELEEDTGGTTTEEEEDTGSLPPTLELTGTVLWEEEEEVGTTATAEEEGLDISVLELLRVVSSGLVLSPVED
jgi:hypothetical protein